MSHWRVLGKLPRARTKEEREAQALEGWNPWREHWLRVMEPDIVVPHPEDASRLCHLHTYGVAERGAIRKFAVHDLPDAYLFLEPAFSSSKGAFLACDASHEGYWRSSHDEASDLPWPEPDSSWQGRPAFLQALDKVEREAERIATRGISYCRLCGQTNGRDELQLAEWAWPAGFRHYVADHDIRPTQQFQQFVSGWVANTRPSSPR